MSSIFDAMRSRIETIAFPGACESVKSGSLTRLDAEAMMRRVADEEYPASLCAFGFGSAISADYEAYGDLDIVVVTQRGGGLTRRCLMVEGVPIDLRQVAAGVMPAITAAAKRSGNAFVLLPISTGVVLHDPFGLAAGMKARAGKALAKGPEPNLQRLQALRHTLTHQVIELSGRRSAEERFACALAIYPLLVDTLFSRAGAWRYRGKWLARTIGDVRPHFLGACRAALAAAFEGDVALLARLAEEVLESCGGPLWSGYEQHIRFPSVPETRSLH